MTRAAEEGGFFFCPRREAQRSSRAFSWPSVKKLWKIVRSALAHPLIFFLLSISSRVLPSPLSPSRIYMFLSPATSGAAGINHPGRNYRGRISGNFKPAFPARTSGIARWLKMAPIVVFLARNSMDLLVVTAQGLRARSPSAGVWHATCKLRRDIREPSRV